MILLYLDTFMQYHLQPTNQNIIYYDSNKELKLDLISKPLLIEES